MSPQREPEVLLVDLGVEDYVSVLDLQVRLAALRRAGHIPDVLVLVEHPPCVTIGRAGGREHLVDGGRPLAEAGIPVHETDRGGSVTYHGPGQLVYYPILDLRGYGRDVHAYVRRLEQTMIRAVAALGVEAFCDPEFPGVWCPQGKIGAVGVAVRGWVTTHGAALNVRPSFEHFGLIVPCGIGDRQVTSVERVTGREVALASAKRELLRAFNDVFGVRLREVPRDALRPAAEARAESSAVDTIRNGRGGGVACLSR